MDQLAGAGGWTSFATAHMNPASSRATAVQMTVNLLPRAENARKRALSRDCAFQAISRIFGGTRSSFRSFFAPTRGGNRYVHALSISSWRMRGLPILVIEPRRTVSPVERSAGTSPR